MLSLPSCRVKQDGNQTYSERRKIKDITNIKNKITQAMGDVLTKTYGWDCNRYPVYDDYKCKACDYTFENGDNYCRNCGELVASYPEYDIRALWDAYQAGKRVEKAK